MAPVDCDTTTHAAFSRPYRLPSTGASGIPAEPGAAGPTRCHATPSHIHNACPSHRKCPRHGLGGNTVPNETPAFAPGYQGGVGGENVGGGQGGHGGGQGGGGNVSQAGGNHG